MFTAEQREHLRGRLIARAEADEAVVGAAFTGSYALGEGDRWSDTDLVLAVRGELAPTLRRWTDWLYDDLGARHHWDLPVGAAVVRVFLLTDWLEVDLTFAPEEGFGPRGPQWRTLFGRPRALEPFAPPDHDTLVGLLWHHALHARACVERGHWWQAEHWISGLRDQVITLACLRLGHAHAYAKGAHLLPDGLSAELAETLVRSLTAAELDRALTAVIGVAAAELARSRPGLAARLAPMFAELVNTPPG
ncbi:hypothetical protein [Streptomyces sp. 351MFTsu5.1]|uniref:hypothetical protein n=1 Tax=Streptomyces sp. 351MFTsu5.1 TaxID=1172180 RepID=UPI000367BE81|nr:hypothetical protein [Streptomyces sp. 351MFTsu5.1]